MPLTLKLAEPEDVRLKMYVYGETGTGKTVTSLHFPNPLVIDTEGGTDHYAKYFKFYREKTADPQVIKNIIDELIIDPQGIKTLIIDSFSVVYDNIRVKHESRLKLKTGNPSYTLQPQDYKVINHEVKSLILKLLSLDMNIIVTARSSILYGSSEEDFMKVLGTKADGPKELPYMFDVVLQLKKENNTFMAYVEKDRTNTLVDSPFVFSYETFVKYLGIEGLEREPVVLKQKVNLNQKTGRTKSIIYKGNEIKTAGITAESLEKIEELLNKVGEEELKTKLREQYYIDSVLDLKEDEAQMFINTIQQEIK